VATTIPFHRAVLGHDDFHAAAIHTRWVDQEFLPAMTAATSAAEPPQTQAAV
jgi:acetyl/propionyl-CoA carboxylase alpha subunit